ncbi:MAG: uracil-DNA glycosylase [Salinarimonas sp.]|nr:uracil-DNA glycosylase [Salinarimonas sp.]
MHSASDRHPANHAALTALLEFYAAAGVDCALDETAIDRFAEERDRRARESERRAAEIDARARVADGARRSAAETGNAPSRPASRSPAASGPQAAGTTVSLDPQEAVAGAKALAAAATDLDTLRDNLAGFDGCALKLSAKSLVFADGTPGTRVMLVGEAPGSEEDRQGKPFVGRSGQLLDRMLAAIGLDRASVYIANVIPWRPAGNRTPTPQEIATCMPFIRRQIELADPDFLICLGLPSAQALMEISSGIHKARGRWQDYHTGKRVIRAMATLHPAYLLRQPSHKRLAWRDLRALRRALDESATAKPQAGPVSPENGSGE